MYEYIEFVVVVEASYFRFYEESAGLEVSFVVSWEIF